MFPLFVWVGIAALFVYFIYIGLYIITPKTTWKITVGSSSLTDANLMTYASYYHLFGFLWSLFFLSGFSQVTIAGAIGSWYWTMDKSERLRSPVLKSVLRTSRFHLGSIALGSLLIAIVEFIRVILYQIQRNLSKSNMSFLKYLVACLQCCMSCVSTIVKFINREAYIYIAIKGKAFFSSGNSYINF